MAVLPESMDKLNVEDTERSLSVIENYIRYMGERIEFSMRNMTRNVSDAGVSSAEMYILLVALQNTVSEISSRLSTLTGTVNTMQSTLNTATGNITTMQGQITAMQESIQSLDERVTALESK